MFIGEWPIKPPRSGGVLSYIRVRDKNESQLCEPSHGTPLERAFARLRAISR
jgi:hypothetical protein